MNKFSSFMEAYETDGDGFSFEHIWDSVKGLSYIKLISKIPHDGLKLYRNTRTNTFFLVDSKENYLGDVQFKEINGSQGYIIHTYSKMSGGFYRTVFSEILKKTEIKEIISDESLSKKAISAYEKIDKDTKFDIKILLNGKTYEEFSKEVLMGISSNRISVKLADLSEAYLNNIIGMHSSESSWLNHKNNLKEHVKLIQDKIGVESLRVYRGGSNFFLTDSEDNYMGGVEFSEIKNGYGKISHTYSKLSQGFHSVMFSAILTESDIDYILSDVSLSDTALASYKRLAKGNMLHIGVMSDSGIQEFSEELLLSNPSFRVVVYEKQKGVLEYAFNDFRNRYRLSESFRDALNNKDRSLDYYLFNQEIII